MDKDKFTLFADGNCCENLTSATVLEKQSFGQFLELRDQHLRSIELTPHLRRVTGGHAKRNKDDTNQSVSITEFLLGKTSPLPSKTSETEEIEVGNLNKLLATKQLQVKVKSNGETQNKSLDLSAEAIQSLLQGRSFKVKDQDGINWIVKPKVEESLAEIPAVTSFTVPSIAKFLSNPSLPGRDNKPFPVKLEPKHVAALRRGDSFEILTVNDIKVRVSPPGNSIESKPIRVVRDGVVTEGSGVVREGSDSTEVVVIADSGETNTTTGGNSGGQTTTTGGNTTTTINPPKPPEPPVVRKHEPPLLGIYLPWKQSWNLLGYARGRLLQSLSLAPQEEVTIDLFTWDRMRRSLEQSSETETDQTFEQSLISKDVTDVVKELTHNSEFQIQADARATVTYPPVTVSVGASLKLDEKTADVSKKNTNNLHESTTKATARVRTHRTSKISEAREIGRENRVTRRLKNQNLCYSVTYDYFEVVAGYDVKTEFMRDEAIAVALLSNPMCDLEFDSASIRLYERALRLALVDSLLLDGFAAARLLASRENAMTLVCEKPLCACEKPMSNQRQDDKKAINLQPLKDALESVAKAWESLRSAKYEGVFEALDFDRHGGSTNPSEGDLTSFRRWMCYQMLYAKRSSVVSAMELLYGKRSSFMTADASNLIAIAQGLKAGLPKEGLDVALNLLSDMSEDKKKIGESHIADYAWFLTEINWLKARLDELGCYNLDDCGLALTCNLLDTALTGVSGQVQQGVDGGKVDLAQQAAKADAVIDQIAYAFPLRDLADAKERFDILQKHLSDNETYYRYAVFTSLPVSEQLRQLAVAATPGWLEPRVIGMVGDKLALPVNIKAIRGFEDFFNDLILNNKLFTGTGFTYSDTVTLPTPGVSMSTRLGKCSASEPFLEESRKIDLVSRQAQADAATLNVKLQKAELDRYKARIDAKIFDDPDLNAGPRPGEWVSTNKL